LAQDERVVELARMLAGQEDSASARAHAQELLEDARSEREKVPAQTTPRPATRSRPAKR
jgi:hypothetical protein